MRLFSLLVVCALASTVAARTVVTETSIEILEDVHFVGTSTQIAAPSLRTIDAVARTLISNPEITKFEVVAYGTDLAASELQQLALGAARARTIMLALEQRGVAAPRLRSRGGTNPLHPSNPIPMFLIIDRQP
jgi:outer membrane protein OmpA-like peptidoglycan-associated protein